MDFASLKSGDSWVGLTTAMPTIVLRRAARDVDAVNRCYDIKGNELQYGGVCTLDCSTWIIVILAITRARNSSVKHAEKEQNLL